jgi:ribonuclease-3
MNPESLQALLGHRFSRTELLVQALTHPSVVYEQTAPGPDNQRLEFLGDAVLQLCLTQYLFHQFPHLDEGHLTKLRARLVSRPALEQAARRLRLGEHLLLGRGEERNAGRNRPNILADAFEAIIGAVFLDAGFAEASHAIHRWLDPQLREVAEQPGDHNPKGDLQEWLQGRGKGTPFYELLEESGPDHAKHFTVAVRLGDTTLGTGNGSSKKNAEISAAADALRNLQRS